MASKYERRLGALESRLPKPLQRRMSYAERLALESATGTGIAERVQGYYAQVARERQEYDALSPDERVARKREQLAALKADWETRNREPSRSWELSDTDERLHLFRCNTMELDILEMEGKFSAEQIEVARMRLTRAGRFGTFECVEGFPLIPLQDEAVRILETARPVQGQLVPSIAGPGPHPVLQKRDVMRPFKGRYGRLDQMPVEDKFAAYGAGQPDWGNESPFEPKVV